jgi:hypothetical protein
MLSKGGTSKGVLNLFRRGLSLFVVLSHEEIITAKIKTKIREFFIAVVLGLWFY